MEGQASGTRTILSYMERMQQEVGEIDMYTFVVLFGDRIEIKVSLCLFRFRRMQRPLLQIDFMQREELFYSL